MATPKIVSSKKVDSTAVRELAELLNETGLTEIEYETEEHRIRVARTSAVTMAAAPLLAPAPMASVPTSAGSKALGFPIKSPLVGTAYLAPQPGAAPFVKVGDAIAEGQTLMIVEAMKVMNPIKAPKGGKVAAIHVVDMTPVEFDEILMEIA